MMHSEYNVYTMWSHRLCIKNTGAMFFSDTYSNRVNCYQCLRNSEKRYLFFLWLCEFCGIVTSNVHITKARSICRCQVGCMRYKPMFSNRRVSAECRRLVWKYRWYLRCSRPEFSFFFYFFFYFELAVPRSPETTSTGSWNCSSGAAAEGRKKIWILKILDVGVNGKGETRRMPSVTPYTQTSVAIVPLYCGENPLLAEHLRASYRKHERNAGRFVVVETGRNYNSPNDDHNGRWYWLWW